MTAKATPSIGLHQARVLCEMQHKERLEFISNGLPIILNSAEGYWAAARHLKGMPREAAVLQSHATEEAAKILILMDAVRCPAELVSSKMEYMIKWFYSHLARLLFAEAVLWRPVTIAELRMYVDLGRKMHSIDGDSSLIFPNWPIFIRESQLYADIGYEIDGEPEWFAPDSIDLDLTHEPSVLGLVRAMSALGIFTLRGLEATSEIWDQVTFADNETLSDAQRLTQGLIYRLRDENILTNSATRNHITTLRNNWQIPMYNLDFAPRRIPCDELKDNQDEILAWQMDRAN